MRNTRRMRRAYGKRITLAVAVVAIGAVVLCAAMPAASADPAQLKWRDDSKDGTCPWHWWPLNWLQGGDMTYDRNGDEVVCVWVA